MTMLVRWVVMGRPRSQERLLWAGKLEGTGLTLRQDTGLEDLSTNDLLCREVQPHCRWKLL